MPGGGYAVGHADEVNRVAVVGPVASGKTTVATRLRSELGLPVLDLDDYYWPHTPLPTDEEWTAKHRELIERERWIISGDYRAVAGARFSAADTVVWLDLPRSTCLYRATLRRLKGNSAHLVDCWRWIWRYAKCGRHETATALANPQLTCTIYRLRSTRAVTSFLNEIER